MYSRVERNIIPIFSSCWTVTNGSYSERHFQTSAAVSDLFKIRYWRIRSEEPETLFLPAPDLFSMMHQKIGIFSGLKNSEYQKNT